MHKRAQNKELRAKLVIQLQLSLKMSHLLNLRKFRCKKKRVNCLLKMKVFLNCQLMKLVPRSSKILKTELLERRRMAM